MLSSQQLPGRMASTSHEADLEPLTGWENSTAFGAAQSGAYLSLGHLGPGSEVRELRRQLFGSQPS